MILRIITGMLPILGLGMSIIFFATGRDARKDDIFIRWGDAGVRGLLVWMVWIWLGVEVLSIWSVFTRNALILWWGVPITLLATVLWRRKTWFNSMRHTIRMPVPGITHLLQEAVFWVIALLAWLWVMGSEIVGYWPLAITLAALLARILMLLPRRWLCYGSDGSFRVIIALAAGTAILYTVSLCHAIVVLPWNWDSLETHLTRQIIWWQNGSVNFFYTEWNFLNIYPPFAEYIQLHLLVLSKTIRSSFIPQMLAWLAIITYTGILARTVAGKNAYAGWLAAFFSVTVGNTFFYAETPKNDLIVALVAILAMWIVWRKYDGQTNGFGKHDWLWLGICCGLAVLTKTILGFVAILPLTVAWLIRVWKAKHFKMLKPVLGLSLIAIVLVAPFALRVHASKEVSYDNIPTLTKTMNPIGVLSNGIKMLYSTMIFPSEQMNSISNQVVVSMHQIPGWDLNDPSTTEPHGRDFASHKKKYSDMLHEDVAGALPHWALFLILSMMGFFDSRLAKGKIYFFYVMAFSGFVLFSATIPWSPYKLRHLQIFIMLAIPAMAVYFSPTSLRRWLGAGIAAVMFIYLFYPIGNKINDLYRWSMENESDQRRVWTHREMILEKIQFINPSSIGVTASNGRRDLWENRYTRILYPVRKFDDTIQLVCGNKSNRPIDMMITLQPGLPSIEVWDPDKRTFDMVDQVGEMSIYLPKQTSYKPIQNNDGVALSYKFSNTLTAKSSLEAGFSGSEEWGSWTVEPIASVSFLLPEGFRVRDLPIEFTVRSAWPEQHVDIFLADEKIGEWDLPNPHVNEIRHITIPASLAVFPLCQLEFRIAIAKQPSNGDTRALGIGLVEMRIGAP